MKTVDAHGVLTDRGQVRRSNEDSYLAAPPLFIVADGMGGARAGEVASQLIVEAFQAGLDRGIDAPARLRRTIERGNTQIHAVALRDPSRAGMGTTVTAALLDDGVVHVAQVGDSRAYLLRDGILRRLTRDHSVVEEMIGRGLITPEEAATHPQRSVITRALGTEAEVDVDTYAVPAETDDVFLLCSDGLTSLVGEPAIARALGDTRDLDAAAQALVASANAAGGEDNITVVLFRIGETDAQAPPRKRPIDVVDEMYARAGEPRRMGRARVLALTVVTTAVLSALALVGLRQSHFVGATADGRVAIYQGVPFEIAPKLRLYRFVEASSVPVAALSREQRVTLFDHELVSTSEARARIDALDAGRFLP